jgi:hypothetical protein
MTVAAPKFHWCSACGRFVYACQHIPAQDPADEMQTSMDVGRPCQGCGSFGRHSKNCYLGDDTDG